MAIYYKLRALRAGYGMYQKDMCELLGLKAESTYSQKERGIRGFSQGEIKKIIDRFNLDGTQIKEIFYSN